MLNIIATLGRTAVNVPASSRTQPKAMLNQVANSTSSALHREYSRDFYRSVVRHSNDLLSVLDAQGVYTFVGDSVREGLGYEPEEMLGRSALEFIHPDDLLLIEVALQKLIAHQSPHLPRFRFRARNGEWRWLECTATNMLQHPDVKGILTSSRDVTESVQLAYERDMHQAYYQSLFFEHPDTVFTLNVEGKFQEVNQHMQELIGYTEKEILELEYLQVVHPDWREVALAAFSNVLQGKAHTVEVRILTKQGTEKDLSVSVMPVYFGSQLMGLQGIAKDITKHVHAQQMIREQAEQLNTILESISEPFFVLDAGWNFTFISKAFATFMNRDRQSLSGRNIWGEFEGAAGTKFYQMCQQVAQHKETVHFEETFLRPRPCILHFTIYPTPTGVAVHFVDVTEHKNTQREIEKLSFVASKTINGVVIMDTEGHIEWVNDGFCRLTGYTRSEVKGLVPSDFLQGPETDPETAARIREKYNSLQPFSEEILNYTKAGEKVWFYIDVTPIFDEFGRLVNFIALETDITEKKEAEAKLLKLADDLYKQNRDLQQFTYIISHNLRAPVANALGLARLVEKMPKDNPNYDLAREKLHTSVKQLDSVIRDINHILSQRESGRVSPREQVNINQVTKEVLESFYEKLEHCHATVHLDIDPSFNILSIRAYLYSIIYNLVSNALKYKSEQRNLELRIRAERDKRGYRLTVSDNGLGFDMPQVRHQLFQLYKRFHSGAYGKGIGLFLIKTQVEALGGKILIDSELDKGTTFTILLGNKHAQQKAG